MYQVSAQKTKDTTTTESSPTKQVAEEFRTRQEHERKLDQGLNSIPKEIASIERTPKSGKEVKTFVVISEMHVSDQLPELKPKAMKCQAEINAVIQMLQKNLGDVIVMKAVHAWGNCTKF